MSSVGVGTGHDSPANDAAYPIALPDRLITQEVLQKNRRRSLPSAFGVTIARDARISADSRSREDKQPWILSYEVVEIAQCPYPAGVTMTCSGSMNFEQFTLGSA
jgi:hypothetical protein